MVYLSGMMEEFIQGNGKIIILKEKESLIGVIMYIIKVNIKIMQEKEKVRIFSEEKIILKEFGKIVYPMEKEY